VLLLAAAAPVIARRQRSVKRPGKDLAEQLAAIILDSRVVETPLDNKV
jgi:hypothetical protein